MDSEKAKNTEPSLEKHFWLKLILLSPLLIVGLLFISMMIAFEKITNEEFFAGFEDINAYQTGLVLWLMFFSFLLGVCLV